ncbi:MAG: FliH/SctL family protein [Clostridia bacterium]|nr:FliH/SctL family protein [Clostridia bacterium]
MSNKIYKNYQVNLGIPVSINRPLNFYPIQSRVIEHTEEKIILQAEQAKDADDILSRAREEAELVLKEAQLEALRLMENAEKEAAQRILKLEEEARKQGYEDGYNEGKRQYEDLIQEAEFIREHARSEYKEVLECVENDVLNLIIEIARKVISNELCLNKENILLLVKEAFGRCTNKDKAVLRVSAEDYEYIVENKERLMSMVEGLDDFEIRQDHACKAGACTIETEFGTLEAGAQSKLKKIEEAFKDAVAR